MSLAGFAISAAIRLITGTFKPLDAVVEPLLLTAIVVLHPVMDRSVKLFGPGWLCRRLYIGVAMVLLATILMETRY